MGGSGTDGAHRQGILDPGRHGPSLHSRLGKVMSDVEVEFDHGIDYEHGCRECGLFWLERYHLDDPEPEECPECGSSDVYRCVGSSTFQLKGSGWSDSGYYNYTAYDDMKKQGNSVTLYDNKEDIERDMRGERAQAERRKLKYRHELEKKVFGNSSLNEDTAAALIKKKVDKVKV